MVEAALTSALCLPEGMKPRVPLCLSEAKHAAEFHSPCLPTSVSKIRKLRQQRPSPEDLLSDLRRCNSFNSLHGWSFQEGQVTGAESRTTETRLIIRGRKPQVDPQC